MVLEASKGSCFLEVKIVGPRYCLDLPSCTIRFVTTFRFLRHERKNKVWQPFWHCWIWPVETCWNKWSGNMLLVSETLIGPPDAGSDANSGSTQKMPANLKELAKENGGAMDIPISKDPIGWKISLEIQATGSIGDSNWKLARRLTWEKLETHEGLNAQQMRIGQTRVQMSCQLPVDKKCGWPCHHGFHNKLMLMDVDSHHRYREHVFITYHPETKNGLAPKCPSQN